MFLPEGPFIPLLSISEDSSDSSINYIDINPNNGNLILQVYDYQNGINIYTTKYVSVKNDKDLKSNIDLLPGILKTCKMGYDGKGQYKIETNEELDNLKLDFKKEFILEKLISLNGDMKAF